MSERGKQEKHYPWKRSLMCMMLSSVLLASCGIAKDKEIQAPISEDKASEENPPTNEPVPQVPETTHDTAPLTGEPLDKPSNLRPLAVMVNNAPQARPQSGLTQADIVYEVLAEGGITRLVAIFQSKGTTEKLGPIRSIRPYLIDIGESYGGVLVHAGGSNDAYAILQQQHKEDLDEISNAGAYFVRDKSRKAPHNLYSDADRLRAGADKRNYKKEVPIPKYTFRTEDELPSGDDASSVDITFLLKNYKVTYAYDAASKQYQRSINGKSHIDLNTGQQLSAANVVVLGAKHKTLDDVGRLSVDVTSGGEAILFQRGKMIKGQWVRTKNEAIRFVKDGQEVPFYPGTTYFNIVPNAPSFSSHVNITSP
ncbi:DUF3048 domain-containing protein [Paenibacillus pini]|uniref:Lipoprotein YerB n=1 Tax=Paenibacillus pini JCM 16418 TaxID=1236976 RepID=W7YCV3_9BACL|nr:DUF3048 domain-containing protein [Paenibacillus pini]GAF08750.1 hypothetical protein JCM16418_2855 [Paenibacillus pini JCM 16418]